MNDTLQDLVNLRGQIEERLNMPGLPVEEKADLFVTLNLIKKQLLSAQ